MGMWGPGLYSSDLALDLKGEIKAILKAPLAPEAITEAMRAAFPAADDPKDEEHTTFWLVLADQLHLAGIADGEAHARARQIIATGADLAVMGALAMAPADLRKRRTMLSALPAKWARPVKSDRKVLSAPQPHAFAEGTCVAYLLMGGMAINPYYRSPEQMQPPFVADGWGAFVVLRTWHVHGVLAMVLIGSLAVPRDAQPDLACCRAARFRVFKGAFERHHAALIGIGTLPPMHAKRMRMVPVGSLSLDAQAVRTTFPVDPDPPRYSEASVSNYLGVPERAVPPEVAAGALALSALVRP